MKVIKKGFNYSQDGPGNRLVFHLQGCNMRCRWCANPESMPIEGVLMVDKNKLLNEVCSQGAVKAGLLNRNICEACDSKVCLHEKRNEGIWQSYFEQGTEEILKEALECRAIMFDDGGVTFSGGEPTLQFDELKDILRMLKEHQIHTAVESNGTSARLPELFEYIDLLIMDFKQIDDEVHKRMTGVSNKRIKQNISSALTQHPNVLIRTPLIHGFNDDEQYVDAFIEFYTQHDCTNASFEFLKYHEYGKEKWEQCGFQYNMVDGYVTDEIRDKFEMGFKRNNLNVIRT